ncbi:MAG: hypothetical protein WCP85_31715, partial [Mariniphaga sp.]
VNKTLDAVIGPLNVAANYVDLISKGDMPKEITDNYNGDFNIIKNNLIMLLGLHMETFYLIGGHQFDVLSIRKFTVLL